MESNNAAACIYELKVGMTCGGCSGAVTRILSKDTRVKNVKCDIEAQQVIVEGDDGLDLCEMLAKWSASAGKSVEFVSKNSA